MGRTATLKIMGLLLRWTGLGGLAGLPALALLLLGAAATPAWAAIRIEVNGVDSELRRNVLALLSLERYKDRDRIEPDAVARLYRRVDGEVRDALRPYGYYDPTVSATLTPMDNQRNWHVQINIAPGEPVRLDTVRVIVHGAGASDPVFVRIAAAPSLRQGERLEHAAYEKVKSDLQLAAATYGYLDARLLRSELQVDPAAHRASVFLELETGERYYFGATTKASLTTKSSGCGHSLRSMTASSSPAWKCSPAHRTASRISCPSRSRRRPHATATPSGPATAPTPGRVAPSAG